MLELKTDWQGNIFIMFSTIFSPYAFLVLALLKRLDSEPSYLHIFGYSGHLSNFNQRLLLDSAEMFRTGFNFFLKNGHVTTLSLKIT